MTDQGCKPEAVSAEAGKTTFRIKNESRRALEFEILKGVAVVDERENILPGFAQSLTTTLDAGDYEMTCGLLSNPKGALKVAANETAKPAKPSAMDLVGAAGSVQGLCRPAETNALVERTRVLVEAVKAGRSRRRAEGLCARACALRAHRADRRIVQRPRRLHGLARRRFREEGARTRSSPASTGSKRVCSATRSVAGLAPFADKLMADTLDLQKRIADLAIAPKNLVGGAAELIEEVASKKISGEEDRYSRTDLWDFQSNIDGAQKITALLDPLIRKQDADLSERLRANFQKVDGLLAKYKTNGAASNPMRS